MIRILLIILGVIFCTSFLQAKESKFKLTFGINVDEVPLEINKMSKNIKTLPGIKINSWILSPNYSSFAGNKKSTNFYKGKIIKDKIYMKFNLKF
ncbi:hypothetical protein OAS21_03625 [Pelagibacteraceae bacterium]|mgnify:CR=1 FL=1|jgi:hypothetical protein|nr:hypothetical protein [Pelagibacteraceae bacterium]